MIKRTFPYPITDEATVWIPLKDGTKLAARLWRPKTSEPVPAILEYLPYRRRDGTLPRDEMGHPYIAGHGYACIRVDIRGTGDSDGLLTDEYTEQELSDALEVINWLCEQAWCTGKVGMMGISWGGFNSLQVAALKPKALKAIITVCSTDDRYGLDIHYKGGALLLENLGWASTMFAYQSRPPDPNVVGDRWREMWLERLEATPLLIKTWLEHPRRDAYWKHGSICEDYSAVEAATLAVGGWYDAYSNTVFRLLENLSAPVRGIVGPWAHKYPHYAIPKPQIGFLQESLRWWDKWLKGTETGVMDEPLIRLYSLESHKPKSHHEYLEGQWLGFDTWPPKEVQQESFCLTQAKLSKTVSQETLELRSPETTGTQSGEFCIIWLGPEWSLDQRPDDAFSQCFELKLKNDLELVGAARLKLRLKSQTPHANLAVRLGDVHSSGEVTRVSYGILNLCQHTSREHPEALAQDKWFDVNIKLDEIAYRFPRGHALRLSLSAAYFPTIWPSAESARLTLDLGNCTLGLPILQQTANRNITFPPAETAPLADIAILEPASHTRHIIHDVVTDSAVTELVDDYGKQHLKRYDLTIEEHCKERYSVKADEPTSAKASCYWKQGLKRGPWQVHTETETTMTCDMEYFYLQAYLKAFEKNTLVFEKTWQEKLKRELL